MKITNDPIIPDSFDFQQISKNNNIEQLKRDLYPIHYNTNNNFNMKKLNSNINSMNILNNNYLNSNYSKNEPFCNNQININNCQNNYKGNQDYINNNINYFSHIQSFIRIFSQNIDELEKKFKILKEKGFEAMQDINNINNYLLFNTYNSKSNMLFNLSQFNNNIYNNNLFFNNIFNNNQKNNFVITLKNKTDNPLIEKETIIKFSTSYKNINTEKNNKNKIAKKKNEIDIELIKSGKEKRTVIRLNHIPQNLSSIEFSKLLDKYLNIEYGKNQRIYKALFVPLSKKIGKNIGYCFIMMVSPKYVIQFYNTFNGFSFNGKKCKKPCNIIWADLQGDKFLNVSDDPMRSPIIFKDLINDEENN